MMFEYIVAYKHLKRGGLLLSHDVTPYWSLAFIDFCRQKHIPYHVVYGDLGIAKKI